MRLLSFLKSMAGLGFLASASACCTPSAGPSTFSPVKAVVEEADDATMGKIATVISAATGRANIEFGAIDLTTTSDIVVLPLPLGPHETHSVAVPILFNLMTDGAVCYVKRDGTENLLVVEGIVCVPE